MKRGIALEKVTLLYEACETQPPRKVNNSLQPLTSVDCGLQSTFPEKSAVLVGVQWVD